MTFVCDVVYKNAISEHFNFEWTTTLDSDYNRVITSKTFCSTLGTGLSFQIAVKRITHYDNSRVMCVGLLKVDEKICKILAIMLFEINNSRGELYLKESLEYIYSQSTKEHFSSTFASPAFNREVRGRQKNLYFSDQTIRIKGKIFFQCCQEKKSAEPLICKNINRLQNDLKNLLQDEVYADVNFHVGDAVMRAHKNILSSRSAVFKTMFTQDMKENEDNTVKITDIEKKVFEVFLIFLYTGIIQDKKLDIIMSLYSVADKYAVETLFKTCSNMLAGFITEETVAPILKLADMHNDDNLKKSAINYICTNFVKVEKTKSWDTLLGSDPRLASCALKQVSISITAAKLSYR